MNTRRPHLCLVFLALLVTPSILYGEPVPPAAQAAFDAYTQTIEARLARQHRSPSIFLHAGPGPLGASPPLEQLSPPASAQPAGALLHHWRATTFIPGATAPAFEQLLRHFNAYPHVFAPQVLQAHSTARDPDHLTAFMRVRQHHVLTVVLDANYDVSFSRLDPRHGASTSRSLQIAEIDAAGTPAEHPLSPAQEHGFLWRQNTYWSYAEQDGGLVLQVESVSLTRAIPAGLGWAVRPFVESIPRESLEFTLRSAAVALHQPTPKGNL